MNKKSASSITNLANKFTVCLTKTAVDALESYPGEDSSNQKKLESAAEAAIDDLTNISNTYYMYESQYEQCRKQMIHQSHLLKFAKKVQELIAQMINNQHQIDPSILEEKLNVLDRESRALGKELNTKISISELQSLRLLKAFLQDEVAKTAPLVSLPNWSDVLRRYRSEDDSIETLDEKDLIHEAPTQVYKRTPDTLKSPGTPEHTNTLKM